MLTNKDISKLISVFATKEDLEEFKGDLPSREDFHLLQRSMDGFMTLHEKLDQEFTIMKADINRIKEVVRTLGGKIN